LGEGVQEEKCSGAGESLSMDCLEREAEPKLSMTNGRFTKIIKINIFIIKYIYMLMMFSWMEYLLEAKEFEHPKRPFVGELVPHPNNLILMKFDPN
jgi:hypothetical protein